MLTRARLERAASATEVPPSYMGLVGRLHGIQVFDWSNEDVREVMRARAGLPLSFDLRYDEMYPAHSIAGIIVGELAHFVYRMRQLAANEAVRKAAREHAEQVELRIFGETLS